MKGGAMFFTFSQNNSGGRFAYDNKRGITHHVVIEADDTAHAIERALSIGLYFNGVDNGTDCACCGDRWHSDYVEGKPEPLIYDEPVAKATGWPWMKEGREICVHYLDGRKEWHGVNDAERVAKTGSESK